MPQFSYRGRDREGNMRTGQRFATTIDNLNSELINEGISPIQISESTPTQSIQDKILDFFHNSNQHAEEMAIFARQMQLLHKAGVPMVTALKQLAANTRSKRLGHALLGITTHLEQGQSLAAAMQQYPKIFSPLIVNIVRIGENTGHLSESFGHIHQYLEFEANNSKQIKSAFRYPVFVLISIFFAVIVLNVFVVPTFARFYTNLTMELPWQTQLLIGSSNFIRHYGFYLLGGLAIGGFFLLRYISTPEGKYQWNRLELRIPVFGNLLKRIILIRFSQSLAIMLGSGLAITQSLVLLKEIILNAYIVRQLSEMQEAIEGGTSFTNAIAKVDLFTPLEIQILAVGEKNGELSPALSYIATFHSQEISFDLKRIHDLIGPIMIAAVSVLILIIALGVYLPIWNMVNLSH